MIDIKLPGLEELRARLTEFSDRRLAATVATALTRTAVKVRSDMQAKVQQSFDKPTPYTMRQLRYVPANAKSLAAAVGFGVVAVTDERLTVIRYEKDLGDSTPAAKYMSPHIDGGKRRAKRFEKALQAVGALPAGWLAVPGARAKMDAYGNQSIGELRQILSWFDAAELVAGSRQNMGQAGRDKRIKGTRKTAGFEYMLVPVGGRRDFIRGNGGKGSKRMQPGIYRRTMLAFGSRIEPVVIFVKGAAYQKKFDFNEEAMAMAERIMPDEVSRAVSEALASLASKGSA